MQSFRKTRKCDVSSQDALARVRKQLGQMILLFALRGVSCGVQAKSFARRCGQPVRLDWCVCVALGGEREKRQARAGRMCVGVKRLYASPVWGSHRLGVHEIDATHGVVPNAPQPPSAICAGQHWQLTAQAFLPGHTGEHYLQVTSPHNQAERENLSPRGRRLDSLAIIKAADGR